MKKEVYYDEHEFISYITNKQFYRYLLWVEEKKRLETETDDKEDVLQMEFDS